MYKCKYIFGQTVKYKGENHKVNGIQFTSAGVFYNLSGINAWIREEEIWTE